jgi:hypothetical protein
MLNLTQRSMSYALYTQHFNDFLRRSHQKLTVEVQCVRFINGLANFELKTHAKSHRSQRGYNVQLVELQNFLNDVVNDSPFHHNSAEYGQQLVHLQRLEVDNQQGSATLRTRW